MIDYSQNILVVFREWCIIEWLSINLSFSCNKTKVHREILLRNSVISIRSIARTSHFYPTVTYHTFNFPRFFNVEIKYWKTKQKQSSWEGRINLYSYYVISFDIIKYLIEISLQAVINSPFIVKIMNKNRSTGRQHEGERIRKQ